MSQSGRFVIHKKKTAKVNRTVADKVAILDWHHANGGVQMHTIKHFRLLGQSLSQSTLAGWIKNEYSIRSTVACNGNLARRARTVKKTEDIPVIENDRINPKEEEEPPVLAIDVIKAMDLVERYTKHKGANDYREFERAWTKISMEICADAQQQSAKTKITQFF
ncbi:hypothetical protein COEREDRAFT_81641 [Coemansia reversa NRRL 1564]|uniref:HTH CENPB-type domain-containing protein n=1 Tax=Coemansia reversa (strain ATCC 12441 / NRRL 1564) TaxID=763665 RepID=A0A2G5BAA3_COERN|nr:hypothetical protein COEREDRAFT_81641 [Coemansia reversa NRRL 1564]|eukprot:PIA15938.1 hypothetical protein COEREDRAFT_81641 [Coemansia reversa NRRL 1564]